MASLFSGMTHPFLGPAPLGNWKRDGKTEQLAGKALKNIGGKKWKSDGCSYWKITI
jgi:hypothetical protein